MINHPHSVAIIGAGPGGLAAAILLASRGARVHIYESLARVGGRTSRLSLPSPMGDFHFDRGPTFFLMPYVLEEIFHAAGRKLTDYAQLTRLDPMYRLVIGRPGTSPLTLDTTQDLAEMHRRLAAISPHDAHGFDRFIADHRRKLEVFTPVLRSPFRSPADLASLDMIKALPWLRPHQSLHDLLQGYFKDPSIELAMSFQAKYLGMSPYDCPSLFSILPFIEYEYGVWHPHGGCNALMTAMAAVASDLGVQIHTSSPVSRLHFQDRRAVAVETPAGMHQHDHIVMNADASWAIKSLIPESLRQGTRESDQKLDAMKYSCSTFMLYLGLRDRLDLPHHTIRVSSRYRENLDDIAQGRLSTEPSFYVCNSAATDSSLAPPGMSSLYVLVPTPNLKSGAIDWANNTGHVREQTLDAVSSLAGRDIRPLIAAEKVITPQDWQASNINFGATFNLAHNLTQMLFLRPQHQLPCTDNVWLVGGGTHPGSGLPVIFLSSQITARLLADRMGLPASTPSRTDAAPEPAFA